MSVAERGKEALHFGKTHVMKSGHSDKENLFDYWMPELQPRPSMAGTAKAVHFYASIKPGEKLQKEVLPVKI